MSLSIIYLRYSIKLSAVNEKKISFSKSPIREESTEFTVLSLAGVELVLVVFAV